MAVNFTFELVSPEKLLRSEAVALVTIPGGEGDYGVLPEHAPTITTVCPGVIEIYPEENAAPSDRIFVAGGFAEVTQTRCTVLADEAMPVADLDRLQLEDAAKAVADKLGAASEGERVALETQQAIINAKLHAIETWLD